MFDYIIIGWAVGLGLIMGHAVSRAASRKLLQQARARAARKVEAAKEQAQDQLRETRSRAKEEALQLLRAGEEQETQLLEDNDRLEQRVKRLDAKQEQREADISRAGEAERGRKAAMAQVKAEAAQLRREAKDKRGACAAVVEELAGETSREASGALVDRLVEEHRALCADRLRNLEASETEEYTRQAKRLMGIAMGRFNSKMVSERQGVMIHLDSAAAARLADNPAQLSQIEEQTGVHLILSDSGDSLRMDTSDGVARELVRRTVARFFGGKAVRDPDGLVERLRQELARELMKKGRSAFKILGLKPAHDEIVDLVGRLSYRTSYTQNQWEHALEASFLAGLLAAELGLDVILARRSTLLHDIGKALSHEIEGSHAVIGAELARKHGEDELVANAVGAHHGDEPMNSPYAPLVAAADAMSGARPGARREMVETYGDRIGDLERIAARFPGVEAVHAVQAGREIRVMVNEKRVSDAKADRLAEQIAEKISAEMTFPGQIRIIVIREFKAMELAS